MSNAYFKFKQFEIIQMANAMKVTTDACVLGALADLSNCNHILDIGAGTGLLTLMQAQKNCTSAQFSAIEIDHNAFNELKLNCKNSKWSNQIHCINQNVKDFANDSNNLHKFDGIISNPPFFSSDLKPPSRSRSNVRHEEESLSMDDLLNCVNTLLSKNGRHFCIYPTKRLDEFKRLILSYNLVCHNLIFIKNNKTKPPHLFIAEIMRKNTDQPYKTTEFIIREQDVYSNQMKETMLPYYL
ncbi:MAG: methyltransferase [Bacteroidia bacterium]|nr:methyltransferase [Bacteroidota bacterium]MCZ2130751.1 methyltransferase [Bacteroidia bacterium]